LKPPVKGKAPSLARGMRLDTAFFQVMQVNVAHLRANESGMLRGRDPEYLHQMRVALRRLRAGIEIFEPVVPGRVASLRKELKWISGELGAARDWDVLVTETLPQAGSGPRSRRRLAELAAVCRRERRGTGARTRRAVRSARYRSLARALALSVARQDDAGVPAAASPPLVDDYASAVLDWHYRRLRKVGAKPSRLAPRALHRFRIALKKFRYAAHFFAGLFTPRAERAAFARLSRLQDILGAINDVVVAEKLAAAVADGVRGRRLRGAKRLLKGWGAERKTALRDELNQVWQVFRASGKYW
jgi:triphosphatase